MRDLRSRRTRSFQFASKPLASFTAMNLRAIIAIVAPNLDHVGIAVKSIASARALYESLGIPVAAEESVEHEQVKTAMLLLGDTRLELLEATAEDSTIAKFIAKRGEGMHHIAIHLDDVDTAFAKLKREGTRLASDSIRIGSGGHRYFFIHPSSANGVLVEIVGDAPAGTEAQ